MAKKGKKRGRGGKGKKEKEKTATEVKATNEGPKMATSEPADDTERIARMMVALSRYTGIARTRRERSPGEIYHVRPMKTEYLAADRASLERGEGRVMQNEMGGAESANQ